MTVLPEFGDAVFSDGTRVDNLFFPLSPGTIASYAASSIDPETGVPETERSDVYVTFETLEVAGIEVVVVRDTAFEDARLVEDTLDFYAQDDDGNVWYLGESVINYDYGDDGAFAHVDFDGAWLAGVDGALPGWIMEALPAEGDSYFQEFYPGVAEDEGLVVATGLEVGPYSDIVKILDTSPLDDGVGSFKYFAPGVGLVYEEEILLAAPDDPELVVELQNLAVVSDAGTPDTTELAFEGDGTEITVTFLSEDASVNGAIGAYVFDVATGVIGEARILFDDTEDAAPGDSVTITVAEGQSLGLFLIRNAETIGLELEDYEEGGLYFRNFLSGDVAALYDADPSTTFTPGEATIEDAIAPVVTNADGDILPILAFHSVANRDGGSNLLNPVGGQYAILSDAAGGLDGIEVVAFEDGLATTGDFDGDFDDAFLAVSRTPLDSEDLETLLDAIGIGRILGSDGGDILLGTDLDDQLIALDGNDSASGGGGADVIEGGDGNDSLRGGAGNDELSGEEGNDQLSGESGADLLDGGSGNDRLCGGPGDDRLSGGDGNDVLLGGSGHDILLGGAGHDELFSGEDGGRLAGGEGKDKLTGSAQATDVFVYDLALFGEDVIFGFEDGADLIEIATYVGAATIDDIEIVQRGRSTLLTFADGTITLSGIDVATIDASDFLFV